MTPDIIISFILLGLTVIGYAVVCGKITQKVDTNTKDIATNRTEFKAIEVELKDSMKILSMEFNGTLKEHVEADRLREAKVDMLKEELQKYVKEQVKYESELRQTQRQTEELKQEMHDLKAEVAIISKDITKISTILEQVVKLNVETQKDVKSLLSTRRQGD